MWEREPWPGGEAPESPVVVTDIRMPFWSMVVFMVKWSIASIPAAIILATVFGGVILLMVAGVVGLGSIVPPS